MSILFVFIKFVVISHLIVSISLIGMRFISSLKIKKVVSFAAIFGSLLGINTLGDRIESWIPGEELIKIANSGSLVFKMILAMLAVYLIFRVIKIFRNISNIRSRISVNFTSIVSNLFYVLLFFSPLIKMFRDELYLLQKQLEDEEKVSAGFDRDLHIERLLSYSEEESQSKSHYKKRVDALYEKREGRASRQIVVVACIFLFVVATHLFFSTSIKTIQEDQLYPRVVTTEVEDRYHVRIDNIKIKDGTSNFSLVYQVKSEMPGIHKRLVSSFHDPKVLSKIHEIFALMDHNEIVFNQNQIHREIDALIERVTQTRIQSSLELLF